MIAEVLRRIGAPGRFFVEFGIETGVEGNCVQLAAEGWSGLFIEGDPDAFAGLQERYSGNGRVKTVHARVLPENVEQIFDEHGVPREPDVLSIDVDGNDFWIWRALVSFRPRLLVIEYNAGLGSERRLVQPYSPDFRWDGTDFFGASLAALRALGDEKGYANVHNESAGVNAFFVRSDLAGRLPPTDRVPTPRPSYGPTGDGHPRDRLGRAYVDLREAGLAGD